MWARSRMAVVVGVIGCVVASSPRARAENGEPSTDQEATSSASEGPGLDSHSSPQESPPPAPEPSPSDSAAADVATSTSTVPMSDIDQAETLYGEAHSRYVAGDVEGALAAMKASYALSRRPELLFNLGQLSRELARCRPAIEYYQQYLTELPEGPRREDARVAIEELTPVCVEERPAAAPAVVVPPAPSPPPPRISPLLEKPASHDYWTPPRVAGWSAIAAGAGLGVTAVVLALRSNQISNEVEDRASWDDDLDQRGRRTATTAAVMAAAAAGVTAGGGVLLWIGRKGQSRSTAVSVELRPGGTYARYSARF